MATNDKNYLVAIHNGLNESLDKQVAALPKDFNKQRFLQNCMTVLQDGQATIRLMVNQRLSGEIITLAI